MFVPSDTIGVFVLTALALATGALWTHLFLRSGLPGGTRAAALLGGMVAGLLMGAGIVGNVAPGLYERWVIGATEERRALMDYESETDAQLAAMRTIGVSPVAIEEHHDARSVEREPLQASYLDALDARTVAINTAMVVCAACAGTLILPYVIGTGRPRQRLGLTATQSVALCVAVVVTIVLVRPATGLLHAQATLPVVLTITTLCVMLTPATGRRTIRGTPTMWTAAALLALCLVIPHLFIDGGRAVTVSVTYLFVPVVVAALLLSFDANGVWRRVRLVRRPLGAVGYGVLLPAFVALGVFRVDPHALTTDWIFWLLALVIGVASSDLRWYVLARIRRASGSPTPYTDAEPSTNAGAGIWQAILAVLYHQYGLIDDRLLGALIIGAVLGEMTVALRRRIARGMDRGLSVTQALEEGRD